MTPAPPVITVTVSPEETHALGRSLGERLSPGDVVALFGPLGSGKTVFVRGAAEARGAATTLVTSPTFTLVRVYPASPPIYHIDAYRLKNGAEFVDLGGRDILAADGIVMIEWAERLGSELPPGARRVEFRHLGENRREIRMTPG